MRFIVPKSQHLATSVKTAIPTSRYKRHYFDHEVKLKSPLPSRIVFFYENDLACSCGYTGVLQICWLLNHTIKLLFTGFYFVLADRRTETIFQYISSTDDLATLVDLCIDKTDEAGQLLKTSLKNAETEYKCAFKSGNQHGKSNGSSRI